MARNVTLGQLVTKLRAQAGFSVNPNLGINSLETMKQVLRDEQQRLYYDFDWGFLKGSYDVDLQAGQRYYDLPVDSGRIDKIEVKYGDSWRPLDWGIDGEAYNRYDSDLDERTDPVERIRLCVSDTNIEQFEAHPIPAVDDASKVRFWGIKALPPLVAETDKCLLDDLLIVLFSAAKMVKDKSDRQMLLSEGQAYYSTLKRRYGSKKRMIVLGGKEADLRRPGPVRVARVVEG